MANALKPISATAATLTLDRHIHRDTVVSLNRAAGVTVTLPAASGSGDRYYVHVGTTVTLNNHIIQVANSSDTMAGVITTATTTTGAGTHEAAGGTDDTITMNGSTTGGIVGSYFELIDVATNLWMVVGHMVGSGVLATPLSAAV